MSSGARRQLQLRKRRRKKLELPKIIAKQVEARKAIQERRYS